MKHIQTRFILLAMFVLFPFLMEAQTIAENETDSLITDTDPLVQVSYRKVAQRDLLGGVSVVDVDELMNKNYFTYSLDNLQGLVGGYTGNSLWGMGEYLVLVDGIPRDANNVLPTEIDKITFLKGASAVVLYGSRAAKGVIYITTKRGKTGPLQIDVRANTGYHVAKSYPKYLGSAEYMTRYNEARANDGLSPSYTESDIYNFGSGMNPYRYPNVDFYSSDFLKEAYNRSDVTAEIFGGSDRAHFYTNISYYHQDDILDFGEAENNNTNRLNIRGNVDVQINDAINAYINTNVTFYNSRSGNATDSDPDDSDNVDNYWTYASTMRPNRVAPLIPLSYIDQNNLNSWNLINNSRNLIGGEFFLGGTQVDQTNIFADFYAGGNSKWTSRQFQFDTGINFDLGNVMEGLSFHTQFAVDYATSYTTSYNNSYAVYAPSWYNYNGTDVIGGLTKYNNDEQSGVQNISGSTSRQTIAFSGYFDYQKTVNDAHNFSAMLVAAGYQQTMSSVYHRTSNANLGLQFGYNYKRKVYLDAGVAGVHSAKLAEGNRNAFSPSVTLGWKLLENTSAFDELMLSASGSILNTDLDIEDYYLYEETYTQASGAWWGWYDGASERSTNVQRGANEDLTFIKRKELSANLRASLWNKAVTFNTSVFVNTMEGMIIEPMTIYPEYFFTYYPDASFVPNVNFNNDMRMGYDFNLNFNKQIGEFEFSLGFAGMYYTTEATQRDENNEFAYQDRQGTAIDGIWGLQTEGLFQSEDEIANSPDQVFGGTVKPGDIKYVNQNGDDRIDDKDVVYLGRGGWSGAPLTGGVNLTAKFKNLTLFALGTGNMGAYAVKDNSYYWISGEGKYSEVVRDRWTEETKATATYPRLTTESGSNNFRTSDFWMYKTDRFNLAKVQLTYDFPKLSNSIIHEVSTYVSGSNLLTISGERDVLELNTTSAPQTRFYNFGIKAVF